MKKIYLCALALFVGSISFGQRNFNKPTKAKLGVDLNAPTKNTTTNNKAPGDVIWSEDFSSGLPAAWTTGGPDGAGWVINSAAIVATYTNTGAIASTSGGDHMLFFAETINPVADRDAYFQTDAIPLTGQPSVTVRFEQKFRLCCSSSAALNLVVSTDPLFPATAATQTYDVRSGVAINDMSLDPLVTSINITGLAGGYTGNIYLRFHWNLGASHYFWMVDDIAVIESVDNDLITFQGYYGIDNVPYTRIPATQIAPVDFSIQATNVGAADQLNTTLTADINSGLFTGTSTPTTLLAQSAAVTVAQATDSLFSNSSFTPPATVGVAYTATLYVASDSTDNTPVNNTVSFPPFEVSAAQYALDDFGTPGAGGGFDASVASGGSGLEDFEAGNFYDVYANTQALSIDVVVGAGTDIGGAIDAVLYEIDGNGDYIEIDRSVPYSIASGDVGSTLNLLLPQQVTLTAGSFYFAAVHAFGGGSEFFYGTSGNSPDNDSKGGPVSLIYYPDMVNPTANYYTSQTPMVRLNIAGAIGVNEVANNANFNVFPNPSAGEFNINLSSFDANNVELTVKNVVGKTILNKTVAVSGNTVETISLSDYSKGIYFLTIDTETVKLIVE